MKFKQQSVCSRGHDMSQTRIQRKHGTCCGECEKLARHNGLTDDEYKKMCVERNGRCDICHEVPAHALHVDHNHETGAVRGLTCRNCNNVIGMAGDSEFVLESALMYLKMTRMKRAA